MDFLSLKNGSDIRGVACEGGGFPVTLLPEMVIRIAKAFTLWLCRKTGKPSVRIAVGHDSRITAGDMTEWITEGVTKSGSDVIYTGLSSTPSMFMLLKDEGFLPCEGSIMITASHLPFYRNGLKFFVEEGGLESADITEILTMAEQGDYLDEESSLLGSLEGEAHTLFYLPKYAANLVNFVREKTGEEQPLKGLKIVVDAGNGAGGFFVDDVLIPLGADTAGSQFLDPDGHFPNHIPNPENAEAMHSVCQAVKNAKADFGIIFDTDVDRAGAVDHNGEEINRNRLIALISAILLKEQPGTIVTDSITSDGLTEFIAAHGGKHHRFKRGYKNVINESKRLNESGEYSPLAIETSGHAALKENYFLDDGAYLIVRILIALAKEAKAGRKITDMIRDLKMPLSDGEYRLQFSDGLDFKALGKGIIADLTAYAKEKGIALATPNYEGIRLCFTGDKEGWALVRMSLHEPIMPINLESVYADGAQKIKRFLSEFFKQYTCFNNLSALQEE